MIPVRGIHLINAVAPVAKKIARASKVKPDSYSKKYPNIAAWVAVGWMDIGRDGHRTSMIRVLDESGLVWEGGEKHTSMDKILQEAEHAIADWMKQN